MVTSSNQVSSSDDRLASEMVQAFRLVAGSQEHQEAVARLFAETIGEAHGISPAS